MELGLAIVVFLFGLIIGSFLNVVIYRLNTSRSLGGRSACMSCSKTLSWHELIPLFSFLLQKGKCTHCSSKISLQYPLVELLSGLVFLGIYYKYTYLAAISLPLFTLVALYFFIIFSILIVILVYDLKHKIIPDRLVYAFTILSFMSFAIDAIALKLPLVLPTVSHLLAGPLLALPFALLWVVSKGRLIGFGDAKLALGVGFLLGISKGIAAFLIAFWVGALVSVILLFFTRQMNMKTEVPFAPFIIFGVMSGFFFNLDYTSIITFIQGLFI